MNYFIGEIQLFGFNFAPLGWAQCNGATLPISQNTALFSLLGTVYGGDSRSNFQLPNLAARAACSQGQGPGLTQRPIGSVFGEAGVTLLNSEMPSHTHPFTLWNQPNSSVRSNQPSANAYLVEPQQAAPFPPATPPPAVNALFSPSMIGATGQAQPHENRQPALAVNYCIAVAGSFFVFPTFS
jgi:microcystin-dependent protein